MLIHVPNADCRVCATRGEMKVVGTPGKVRNRARVVTFPRLQRLPVLHHFCRLFVLLVGSVLKGLFALFVAVSLAVASHQTSLKSICRGKSPVLPQQNGAFIIRTREHASQVVPADAVHG